MIRFRVRELAEGKGWNIAALAEQTGLAYSSALDLWHDRAQRIDKKTIEKLCIVFQVQPGELVVWEPASIDAQHEH